MSRVLRIAARGPMQFASERQLKGVVPMAARAAKVQVEKVSARRAGTWRKRNAVKRRESRTVRLGWSA